MTNIFKTQEKVDRKARLLEIGEETLKGLGWAVSKESGLGKASVRRITKDGVSKRVSIRTTQDRWIAFPPKPAGKGWITLDDVDVVLAVSVNEADPPTEALVHWLEAEEMRGRFDRAISARRNAGRRFPKRRGIWIPLYAREGPGQGVNYVGGGAGLDFPPIASVPLAMESSGASKVRDSGSVGRVSEAEPPLTIATAKRRLAASFGVPESSITITVQA